MSLPSDPGAENARKDRTGRFLFGELASESLRVARWFRSRRFFPGLPGSDTGCVEEILRYSVAKLPIEPHVIPAPKRFVDMIMVSAQVFGAKSLDAVDRFDFTDALDAEIFHKFHDAELPVLAPADFPLRCPHK